MFIIDNASGAKILSGTQLGFFVIIFFALIIFKFLNLDAALEQSPSVIIDNFFKFLSFTKVQPNLLEAIADNIFEKKLHYSTNGM